MHLYIRDTAPDACGYGARAQLGRTAGLPVPHQRGAATNTREKVVHGASSNRSSWRSLAFWINLHRNVSAWTFVIGSYSKRLLVISFRNKAILLQAWTGPEGSRRLRLPDFMTIGTRRW